MKNSKLNNKIGLFGLLVFSLAMSQSWIDRTGSAEAASMASSLPANVINGELTNIEVTVDGKKVKENMKFTLTKKRKRTILGNDAGEVLEASFCSSFNCGNSFTIDEWADDAELTKIVTAFAKEALLADYKEEQEKNKKRGDLEARKKKAEKCKIKIVDEDDESEDIKLTDSEYASERMDCKVAKFNKREFKSERAQYRAFKKAFGKDLTKMILSGDDEEREDAISLLEESGLDLGNDRIEDYLKGFSIASQDYANAIAAAENNDVATLGHISNWYTTRQYMQDSQQTRWGYTSRPRNSNQVDAFNDLRTDMIRRMNIAMEDPQRLINESFDGFNDISPSTGAGRGGRVRTNWQSMPTFDNNSMLQTNGRNQNMMMNGQNGNNNINGQWIPQRGRSQFNNNQQQQFRQFPNQAGAPFQQNGRNFRR